MSLSPTPMSRTLAAHPRFFSDGAIPRPKKTKTAPSAPTPAAHMAIKATPSAKEGGGGVKTPRPSRQPLAPTGGGKEAEAIKGNSNPKGGVKRPRSTRPPLAPRWGGG